jgi:hypothetical protein
MSAPDPVTPAVHDSAAVVFSRAFSFVEWKYVVASDDPFATGERGGEPPYRDIFSPKGSDKGERWIYAFSRTTDHDPFKLVEEIRLSATGEMAATRAETLFNEVGARGTPEPSGKTLVLPRRRFGWVLEYRFYASRVRLPLALIRTLEGRRKDGNPDPLAVLARRIDHFAPRVYLDPGDNSSVFEREGKMLVPVVDPLAIMLNWHASFEAAAADIINYTTPHRGMNEDQRARVARRRKQHLLADLLNRLLAEEAKNLKHDLASQLAADGRTAIASFVADYEAQVRWRTRWRDQTAGMLTRWLQSGAIATAEAAHNASSKAARDQFRTLLCHAHAGLAASPEGSGYLARVIEDKHQLAHAYLWSTETRTDDQVQWARKNALTVLEGYKAIAAVAINPEKLTVSWRAKPEEVEARLNALMGFKKGTLDVETASKVVAGKSLSYVELKVSFEKEPAFTKTNGVIAAIEAINFLYAVVAAREQLTSSDPQQRQQALIGLLGSALDAGTAAGKLLRTAEGAVRVMSFVSGVIDVYMAVGTMNDRYALGDLGGAQGSFLVAAGSTIGTAGVALEMLGVAGLTLGVVGVLALAIVAIGYIYKVLYGRTPLQIFFAHCTWGKERDEIVKDTPDWSPTNYKEWHGTLKGFDHQLQALLNLICKFEIGHALSYRQLVISFGWIPPGAKLGVGYQESWETLGPTKQLDGSVAFGDQGPTATGPFRASMKDTKLTLIVDSPSLPNKDTTITIGDPQTGIPVKKAKGLKSVQVVARLQVTFQGVTELVVPSGRDPVRVFFRP